MHLPQSKQLRSKKTREDALGMARQMLAFARIFRRKRSTCRQQAVTRLWQSCNTKVEQQVASVRGQMTLNVTRSAQFLASNRVLGQMQLLRNLLHHSVELDIRIEHCLACIAASL